VRGQSALSQWLREPGKLHSGLAARSVPERYLIWPAKEIARVCGVHDRTIRQRAKDPEHPLKVIRLGHGLTTTLSLLDQWVIERWEAEGKTPRSRRGRPLRGGNVSEGKRWGVEVRVPRPEGETEA